MRFVTVSSNRLVELNPGESAKAAGGEVSTCIPHLDDLLGGCFVRGAAHELLYPAGKMKTDAVSPKPTLPALLLARGAMFPDGSALPDLPVAHMAGFPVGMEMPVTKPAASGVLVISDPKRQFYPPAAAQLGFPLSQVYFLHPKDQREELWAISECLASAGVAAVIASVGKLTQVEARRIQLAAERGGSMAILLRPRGPTSNIYSAASRLLVTPAPAPNTASQCWRIELLHGHGGQVGKNVVLEYNREEHTVHTSAELADHKAAETAAQTAAGRRATA